MSGFTGKLLPRERLTYGLPAAHFSAVVSVEPDRGNERNEGELEHALSEPDPHSHTRKKTGTLPESCDDFQNPVNHFDHRANSVHETGE
jgi:hypothetical protein